MAPKTLAPKSKPSVAAADSDSGDNSGGLLTLSIDRPIIPNPKSCGIPDEFLTVHIGHHAVETTIAYGPYDDTAASWFKDIDRPLRCTRGPLVAGIRLFRGVNYNPLALRPRYRSNFPQIRALAICFGGDQVLIFQDKPYGDPAEKAAWSPELRDFLANRRLNVVGVAADDDAKWIESHWGMKVARPVDLHRLAAMAVGKEKVWRVNIKRAGPEWCMKAAEIEDLAALPEFGGLRAERKDAVRILNNDHLQRGNAAVNDEKVMQATLYAYLCYEIGMKAMKMTGKLVFDGLNRMDE